LHLSSNTCIFVHHQSYRSYVNPIRILPQPQFTRHQQKKIPCPSSSCRSHFYRRSGGGNPERMYADCGGREVRAHRSGRQDGRTFGRRPQGLSGRHRLFSGEPSLQGRSPHHEWHPFGKHRVQERVLPCRHRSEKEPENSENPTFAQQAPLHADDGKGNRREADQALCQQPHPHPSRFRVPVPADEAHRLPNPPQTGRRRQAEEHLHTVQSGVCPRQRALRSGGRRITSVAGLLPPIIG